MFVRSMAAACLEKFQQLAARVFISLPRSLAVRIKDDSSRSKLPA
jgi:hypothetical protein